MTDLINDDNFDIAYEKSLKFLKDRISEIEQQIGSIDDHRNHLYTEEERYQKYSKTIERLGDCIEEIETIKSQHGDEFPEKWEKTNSVYKNIYKEFISNKREAEQNEEDIDQIENVDQSDDDDLFSFMIEVHTEIKKITSDLILQRRPSIPVFMFEPDEIFRYSNTLQTNTEKIEYLREILDEYNYFFSQFTFIFQQFIISLSESKIAKLFEIVLNIKFKDFFESNKTMIRSIINPHIPNLTNMLSNKINSLERHRYIDQQYNLEITDIKPQEATTDKQNALPDQKHNQGKQNQNTEDQRSTEQPLNKFYRINDLCDLFKVSRNTIYNWMNTGQLPYSKMGSKRFVSEEDLNEALKRIDFTNWQEIPDIVMERKYKKNK